MAVHLGGKPLASFSEPIEMMADCHRRIEHYLDVLQRVERRYGERALDDEGRRALDASLNYFTNFAPRHTADEEHSLFPRMRYSEDASVRAVMAELDRLESDHRRCEEGHALVDQIVTQWLETGSIDDVRRNQLRAVLEDLTGIYAAHIQLEEQHIFAVAARILTSGQLSEIGEEMKERRSLTNAGHPIAAPPESDHP